MKGEEGNVVRVEVEGVQAAGWIWNEGRRAQLKSAALNLFWKPGSRFKGRGVLISSGYAGAV